MARKAQPKYTEEDVVRTLVNAFSASDEDLPVAPEAPVEATESAVNQRTWTTESGAVVVSYH